jgi:prephenate dehydrogenase
METVAIVGVGLIGGSFALALKQAGFSGRVLGVSSVPSVRVGMEIGAIDEGAELAEAAAREFREWVRRIGAKPFVLEPEEHDRIVAYTSHLAQLMSTALGATVAEQVAEDELTISGPGLQSSTRLAMSSYELWRDIVATNAEAIDRALQDAIQKLDYLRQNLKTRALQEEFERAGRLAGRLRETDSA